MPDTPIYVKHDHPVKMPPRAGHSDSRLRKGQRPEYAELCCKTNFSFLRGASHPEQLAERAAELGYAALAITDDNTLAGVVRMHCAAKACGLKLLIGAEITPVDGPPMCLYAMDRAAYGRLCRIITQGRLREKKGSCAVTLADVAEGSEGLIAVVGRSDGATERRSDGGECRLSIVDCRLEGLPIADFPLPIGEDGRIPPSSLCRSVAPSLSPNRQSTIDNRQFSSIGNRQSAIGNLHDLFPGRLYLAASVHEGADDDRHLAEMAALSRASGVPLVATNDVHYHDGDRRFLQDVLTCIREHCTLENAGIRLFANAERHLKPVEEMARLFRDYPEAIARTVEIADRCHFSLEELRYEYPEALCPPGRSADEYLAELTWAGARRRYPAGLPDKVRGLIEHELKLIGELRYEPYFLTVWDIVEFARSRAILCQGRGSAANSAVCYCLGITSVDPDRIDLLFERFVSAERNEPPDIDVDFEHERREEVFQYIYNKYGREHAGIVAEVISYRPRSAIRDVGKALGLSLDKISLLAKKHEWWDKDAMPDEFLREAGFDPQDRTLRMLRKLVGQIKGFPRHLSQHVGGFVITRGPLCEMVPIENGAMPDRTFIEWDKDDIDALGILKIDCLALGMLTAIRKCFRLMEGWAGSDGATKRRSDEGKTRRCDDEGENVSRFDRVAEGDGSGEARIPIDCGVPRQRTVRPDITNAAGSGLDPLEHRRGPRTGESARLHSVSQGRPGIADGAANTDAASGGSRIQPHSRGDEFSPGGNRSSSPGFDPKPGSAAGVKAVWSASGKPVADDRGSSNSASLHGMSAQTAPLVQPASPSSLRRFVASSLSLASIPPEDPAVYDMICRADTVGVFQIESRAQMSMLPRLRPRCFYDLVIEVAIVRPGPIQGGMVHPYLRRRNGEEPVTYPSEAIKGVLQRTLGVPLFQEQAMKLAVVAADFTPGEADRLRRAMGAWRRHGDIGDFRTKLIEGMKRNGLPEDFAERCYQQICGFGEYGFPESHAASFALLVYVSAWLKRYHPAAFCAAILNSLPMGFYQPAQLVRDAREHGVCVLPVEVNASGYDCRLSIVDCRLGEESDAATGRRSDEEEKRPSSAIGNRKSAIGNPLNRQSTIDNRQSSAGPSQWGVNGPAVRLGMRLVRGISGAQVEGIERARRERAFRSVVDLAHRSGASRATLARLAAADAMRSMGLTRREALWQVLALRDDPPLLSGHESDEPATNLPPSSRRDTVLADYQTVGLSLTAHPIELVRGELSQVRVQPAKVLQDARHGQWIRVGGLVLVRQRPGTAKGIVFCTLEDETGIANLIIRPQVYEKYRRTARGAVALVAEGRVERQGEVIHINVSKLTDMSDALADMPSVSRDFH